MHGFKCSKNENTFYGGQTEIGDIVEADAKTDIICFDNTGKILCSGKKMKMLRYAKEHNVACACLIPLRYSICKSQKSTKGIIAINQN